MRLCARKHKWITITNVNRRNHPYSARWSKPQPVQRTMRPFTLFATHSASYQGEGSKPNGTANDFKNWTSDWKNGNTKNTRVSDGVLLGLSLGVVDGSIVGATEGISLGLSLGEEEGSIERLSDGTSLGLSLGLALGLSLGLSLGYEGGSIDGLWDGALLGLSLGEDEGSAEGL